MALILYFGGGGVVGGRGAGGPRRVGGVLVTCTPRSTQFFDIHLRLGIATAESCENFIRCNTFYFVFSYPMSPDTDSHESKESCI